MSRHLSGRAALAALVLIIGFASLASAAGGDAAPHTERADKNVIAGQVVPLFELPPGTSITIEIDVQLNATVDAGLDEVCNTATASGDNFGDVSVTTQPCTPVDAAPAFTLDKSYDGPVPPPGNTAVFDLAYANVGNQGATGVVLTEVVPAGTTWDGAGGWSCLPDGNAGSVCTLAIGGLAASAGGAATFGLVLDPGVDEVVNCADVEDDDANGGNPFATDCATLAIDNQAPIVATVAGVPATPDGVLADCETAQVSFAALQVQFADDLVQPGDGGGQMNAADVSDPGSYVLVGTGADLDFDTLSCATVDPGNDELINVTGVTYDAATLTAELTLAAPLAAGQHRLFVCDTIRDQVGNNLDGDDDGAPGGDFLRLFRADPENLLVNGNFDCDFAGWDFVGNGDPAFDSADASNAAESGSLSLSNPADLQQGFGVRSSCVGVTPGQSYFIGGGLLLNATPASEVSFKLACDFYATPAACAANGAILATRFRSYVGDVAGSWTFAGDDLEAPAGAAAARCSFTVNGADFDANLDQLFVGVSQIPIFADDFETGNMSRWNQTP